MNRLVFSLLAFSMPFVASASAPGPVVGQQAVYSVTTTRDGRAMSSTNVTELVKFDDESHRYLERDTVQTPGQPDQVHSSWKGVAELMTQEKIEGILADCDETGGRSTLRWVPAGLFSACVLPVSADDQQPYSGRVWIGRVPFGIVHAELTQNGASTVLDLRDYQQP